MNTSFSFKPILLKCGSPSHVHECTISDFMQKGSKLLCPTCSKRITSPNCNERFHIDVALLNIFEQVMSYNKLSKESLNINDKTIEVLTQINKHIDIINQNVDSFPFREISGLEFIANENFNTEARTRFAYSLPGNGTIRAIKNWILKNEKKIHEMRIIEYGAGTALWSRFFLENGLETLAIDCKSTRHLYVSLPEEESHLTAIGRKIQYIEPNECGLPDDCSNEILFLCWPENPNNAHYQMYAERVLREFRSRNGAMAIYVGAERGGNTADLGFFDEMEKEWTVNKISRDKKVLQNLSNQEYMYFLNIKNTENTFNFSKSTLIGIAIVVCLPFLLILFKNRSISNECERIL